MQWIENKHKQTISKSFPRPANTCQILHNLIKLLSVSMRLLDTRYEGKMGEREGGKEKGIIVIFQPIQSSPNPSKCHPSKMLQLPEPGWWPQEPCHGKGWRKKIEKVLLFLFIFLFYFFFFFSCFLIFHSSKIPRQTLTAPWRLKSSPGIISSRCGMVRHSSAECSTASCSF